MSKVELSTVITSVLWLMKLKYKEVDIHVRLEQSVAVVGFTQQSLLCRKNYCAIYFL